MKTFQRSHWLLTGLSVLILYLRLCSERGNAAEFSVDANFPGGNVIVVNIENNLVHLRPDQRGTASWWFYWSFRVSNAGGRTIRFQFDGRNPIGSRGAAISQNQGMSWSWHGIENVSDKNVDASFQYDFPEGANDVRFAFCPPYVASDWKKFVKSISSCQQLSEQILAHSEKNRAIELLSISPPAGRAKSSVILTARHHSSEAMASYVLEGIISKIVADDEDGRWMRDRIHFLVVPFMDKDGVEEGDQGKERLPHDHWLDYVGESRYNSVAALKKLVTTESKAPVHFAMDMHCSYLRDKEDSPGCSEQLFFMNSMESEVAAETAMFQRILLRKQRGPITYFGRYDLPFGTRWNALEIANPSFLGWASRLPGIRVATVLEVPYANAGGIAVTTDTARQLGNDLANAMYLHFRNHLDK